MQRSKGAAQGDRMIGRGHNGRRRAAEGRGVATPRPLIQRMTGPVIPPGGRHGFFEVAICDLIGCSADASATRPYLSWLRLI